jgi:Zn-finger nucleic acid-binding protein
MKNSCPVCNSTNIRQDYDFPDTMDNCEKCGSEWVRDGEEITLDARDYFTVEENLKLNRNKK